MSEESVSNKVSNFVITNESYFVQSQEALKTETDSSFAKRNQDLSNEEKNAPESFSDQLRAQFIKLQQQISKISEIQNLHLIQVSQNVDILENLRSKLVLEGFLQKKSEEFSSTLPIPQQNKNSFSKLSNNISIENFDNDDNIINQLGHQLKLLKNNQESFKDDYKNADYIYVQDFLKAYNKSFDNEKNLLACLLKKSSFNSFNLDEKKDCSSLCDESLKNEINYLHGKTARDDKNTKHSEKITGCPHTNRKHYAKVSIF
jgi:hypothetical protein